MQLYSTIPHLAVRYNNTSIKFGKAGCCGHDHDHTHTHNTTHTHHDHRVTHAPSGKPVDRLTKEKKPELVHEHVGRQSSGWFSELFSILKEDFQRFIQFMKRLFRLNVNSNAK
jgi:hypothetical protein